MTTRRRGSLRAIAGAALLIGLAAPVAPAQEGKVLPVDEATRNPDFFAFRAQLQGALARRDTAFLLGILDPEIKLTFGGSHGPDDFRELWLREPVQADRFVGAPADVWEELAALLALGGRFENDSLFVAPYVFTEAFPEGASGYDGVAVLGADVSARTDPAPDAEILARLSFDAVRVAYDARYSPQWQAVLLADDRPAWIRSNLVRSPIDYRAAFRRTADGWRMIYFIAGD